MRRVNRRVRFNLIHHLESEPRRSQWAGRGRRRGTVDERCPHKPGAAVRLYPGSVARSIKEQARECDDSTETKNPGADLQVLLLWLHEHKSTPPPPGRITSKRCASGNRPGADSPPRQRVLHSAAMATALSSLSVVLPAYNEEGALPSTLRSVLAYMRDRRLRAEVIVVDDGSRDRTAEVVTDAQRDSPEIRLIRHERNRGYGEALRSGFSAAQSEWIFLMDADGQFDITNLDSFLPSTDDADMILGYREHRADRWSRRVLTWGYTRLMGMLFHLPLRDHDCAFKLFRRSTWEAAQPIRSTDHKIFTVEWLSNSLRRGARMKELPVHHYPRTTGQATGARLDVIWTMVKALVRLWRRRE